jgi:hypothetical protein
MTVALWTSAARTPVDVLARIELRKFHRIIVVSFRIVICEGENLSLMNCEPDYKNLRSDPRFSAMLGKIG